MTRWLLGGPSGGVCNDCFWLLAKGVLCFNQVSPLQWRGRIACGGGLPSFLGNVGRRQFQLSTTMDLDASMVRRVARMLVESELLDWRTWEVHLWLVRT